jgi:hypothetical protein
MIRIKDKKLAEQIKRHPVSKEQFETALKKTSQRIEKPKPSPKQSKT